MAAGLALGAGAILIGASVGRQEHGGAVSAIAVVNGEQVTRDEFDSYALVFTDPSGSVRITREQILTSLINQELATQEAARRGITVDDRDVDSALAIIGEMDVTGSAFSAEGGQVAFRARIRARILMEKVKAVVASVPMLEEALVRREYDDDGSLHVVSYAEIHDKLADRIHEGLVERRWTAWLAQMRGCSEIRVLDTSVAVTYPRSEKTCP